MPTVRGDNLAHYLRTPDAQLASFEQMANLARVRRAHGRPLSQAAYTAIRAALAEHEADERG